MDKLINYSEKALSSLKWSYLATILPKIGGPISLIILARLLMPEDYGILATSITLTSLLHILSSGGLAEVVIQRDGRNNEKTIQSAFWINFVLSLFFYIFLYVSSPFLSEFFNEPRLELVFKVHGLIILFKGWSVVHIGVLTRSFSFKKLTFLAFIPLITNFIITIPLAYFGYHYWSLVIGSVISSFISLILYFVISKFRPSIRTKIDFTVFNFSIFVMLDGLIGWIFANLDVAIISKYLSISTAGNYFFAKNLITLSFGTLISPIFTIIFAYFSRLFEHESAKMAVKLSKVIKLLSFVVFPLMVAAYFVSPIAIPLLFSNKWDDTILIFQILLLGEIAYLFMPFPEAFKAIGKPQIMLKINLIQAVFAITLFYYTASFYGVIIFCIARLSLSWIFGFHLYYGKKYLHYNSFFKDIGGSLILSTSIFAIFLFLEYIYNFYFISVNSWIVLTILIVIGFILYLFSMTTLFKSDVLMIRNMLKKI